jgi:hypothetical protein
VVEGARLESVYAPKVHPGFESQSLRQQKKRRRAAFFILKKTGNLFPCFRKNEKQSTKCALFLLRPSPFGIMSEANNPEEGVSLGVISGTFLQAYPPPRNRASVRDVKFDKDTKIGISHDGVLFFQKLPHLNTFLTNQFDNINTVLQFANIDCNDRFISFFVEELLTFHVGYVNIVFALCFYCN